MIVRQDPIEVLTRRIRGLGLRLRSLLGGCDIAVETRTQEYGNRYLRFTGRLHMPPVATLTLVNQKVKMRTCCLEHNAPAKQRDCGKRGSEVFGCILHGARAWH